MRTIIYSDLQLHEFKSFASVDSSGMNSRLKDHINVLNEIKNYAVGNDIKYVISNGDDIDQRSTVSGKTVQALLDWRHSVSQHNIKQLSCSGNHDKVDKSSDITSMDLFKYIPNHIIYTKPKWHIFDDGTAILFIPFQNKVEDVIAGLRLSVPSNITSYIVLIHYGLQGIDMGNGIVIQDPENLTEGFVMLDDLRHLMDDQRCKKILFGHIHINSKINDKIEFIGTLLQHNFGEKDINCRYIECDSLTGNIKNIYPTYPKFVEFESITDITEEKTKGNFVRLTVEDPEHRDKFKELLIKYGARGVEIIVAKRQVKLDSKLNLNLSMSFQEMGKRLIDLDSTCELDKDKLELIMKQALEAVGKD